MRTLDELIRQCSENRSGEFEVTYQEADILRANADFRYWWVAIPNPTFMGRKLVEVEALSRKTPPDSAGIEQKNA